MEAEHVEEHEESGLVFRFPGGQVFKPDAVPEKGLQGVKGCDFVWLKSPERVFIVEVKSSAPRGGGDLQTYLGQIAVQFLHGALLWLAALGGRHQQKVSLPEPLQRIDALRAKPRLILVVSGLPRDAADPLQNALQQHVGAACRAFAMEQPLVLNANTAARYFPVGYAEG